MRCKTTSGPSSSYAESRINSKGFAKKYLRLQVSTRLLINCPMAFPTSMLLLKKFWDYILRYRKRHAWCVQLLTFDWRDNSPFSQAAEDDIMPFSTPITTASGTQISNLVIRKGTIVTSPIHYMNRAEVFWGADASEFVPERWLDGGSNLSRAREIQGHRHILTFSDGPRMCLGKSFALTEFKVRSIVAFLTTDWQTTYLGHSCCTYTQLHIWASRWSWDSHWEAFFYSSKA